MRLLLCCLALASRVQSFAIITSRAGIRCRPFNSMNKESDNSDVDKLLPKIYSTLDEVGRDLWQSGLSAAADDHIKKSFLSPSSNTKMPHLFLHFDVNETILIGDPAGGDTVEECLNKILAKSAFVSVDEPSNEDMNSVAVNAVEGSKASDEKESKGLTRSPSSGNITTTSTHQLAPTHWWNGQSLSSKSAAPLYVGWTWPPNTCPYYRTAYKKNAKNFIEGHGSVYRPLYDELCAKLGLNDDHAKAAQEGNVFANFVPAFFHTLQHYFPSKTTADSGKMSPAMNIGYLPPPQQVTLVLRTFGTDLPRVAKCISEFAKGKHPDFRSYYNPDLILDGDLFCSSWTYRDVHGNVVDDKEAELVYELHSTTAETAGEHSQNRQARGDYCGDDAILNYLETKTIVGIQDCYPFWRDNNHQPWAGKPVWARTNKHAFSRHDHHHILLDDNIHNDANDGAGGIRTPKSLDGEGVERHASYESLHGNEALNMHGKHLLRVPTICPLMENDWFVRKIEEVRWKHFEEDLADKLLLAPIKDQLDLSGSNLKDNDLSHAIWPIILSSLDLGRNSLKNIPSQVFSYSTLTSLDISRNAIQGIPSCIKNLHNLVQLIALSNHLRLRQLPLVELASLKRLKLLDFRYNRKLKQSALDKIKEILLPNNSQLKVLCTIPSREQLCERKLSACDRDATVLRSQLEPISTPQLCKRLERAFGITLDKDESEQAYDREFVMTTLLECYSKHGPREVRRELGIPISGHRQVALLKELQAINWPRTTRERPKIKAEYYMILQKPGSGKADSVRTKKETAKLMRYQKLFDLAVETLSDIDPSFAERFTALAVTKNFIGSPHIDTLNVGPFYGMSLGDFYGGGAIAVECSPLLVAEVETKGRLGRVDGRFPHWVTPYSGNRYSLIYYVTSGAVEPQTTAIFAPPREIEPDWEPPPTFVP